MVTSCDATLMGGWDRGSGDRGAFGVVLKLGTPAELLTGLYLEDVRPSVSPHPYAGRMVAFTGESVHQVKGVRLDRHAQEALAEYVGCKFWPRVTKQVEVCVVSDPHDLTGNLEKAEKYEVDLVRESDFWPQVGIGLPHI